MNQTKTTKGVTIQIATPFMQDTLRVVVKEISTENFIVFHVDRDSEVGRQCLTNIGKNVTIQYNGLVPVLRDVNEAENGDVLGIEQLSSTYFLAQFSERKGDNFYFYPVLESSELGKKILAISHGPRNIVIFDGDRIFPTLLSVTPF